MHTAGALLPFMMWAPFSPDWQMPPPRTTLRGCAGLRLGSLPRSGGDPFTAPEIITRGCSKQGRGVVMCYSTEVC